MGFVKQIRIYRCDTCGKEAPWGEGWLTRLIVHQTWDEILTVCSKECADFLDEKREKEGGA